MPAAAAPPRVGRVTVSAAPPDSTAAERKAAYTKLFERWKALPLPNIVGKPRVRVVLRGLDQPPGALTQELSWPLIDRGFLISESRDRFTVLLDTFRLATFMYAPDASAHLPYGSAEYVKQDLSQEIQAQLDPRKAAAFAHPLLGSMDPSFYGYLAYRFHHPALEALLARTDLIGRAQAQVMPGGSERPGDAAAFWNEYRARLLLLSAALDLRYGLPWSDAVSECRLLGDEFGDTAAGKQGKELVPALERARAEEASPPADPLRRRVWDLRNEATDLTLAAPDEPEPFFGDTPANRLLAQGLEAAPDLIRSLEDPRPTRSISFTPQGIRVARVGDVALLLLEKLAARTFIPRGDDPAGTRNPAAEARTWWAAVQARGERAVLEEGIRGPEDLEYQAHRLVARYPLDALEAIDRAMREIPSPAMRAELVSQAAWLPRARPWLRKLLEDPVPDVRLAAAESLSLQGDESGVSTILDLLRTLSQSVDKDVGEADEETGGPSWVLQRAIQFLADSDREWAQIAAWRMLAHGPATLKRQFLSEQEDADQASRAVLGMALEDRTVLPDGYLESGGAMVILPRACDLAATYLARRLPRVSDPALSLSFARRDREVARIRNAWRRADGLPPVPVPPPSKSTAPDRIVRVVIDGVAAGHPVRKLLSGWSGKPLDMNAVGRLARSVASRQWAEVDAFQMIVDHPGHGEGTTLYLSLWKAREAAADLLDTEITLADGEDNPSGTEPCTPDRLQSYLQGLVKEWKPRLTDPQSEFLLHVRAQRSAEPPIGDNEEG